ncbi:MAG TPA: aldose epimerase family protein [Tepidisphaeraceae bacterium]|jgi:aldose 1-epimerase
MTARSIAAVTLAAACLAGCARNEKSKSAHDAVVASAPFGKLADGQTVNAYTLKNDSKMNVKILDLGGVVQSLTVPDRDGNLADVVLGFENPNDYMATGPYFGAIAGRYANRIANGRFSIDGKTFTLPVNNGPNSLHGGTAGFDKKMWTARSVKASNVGESAVEFTLISPDGDQGYPGTLTTTVRYTLTRDNALRIDYTATTDKTTVLNLTNHSYFNLTGDPARSTVERHVVTVNADAYTPVDATQIPTGEIKSVDGTPFDFRTPHAVGDRLAQTGGDPAGYDHNFVLNGGESAQPRRVATLTDPGTGRMMEVWTTEPGVQVYSGNFLDGSLNGKGGVKYGRYSGICFETQHYPDSPNQPKFPSTLLRPGETFRSTTIYKFTRK